MQICSRWPVTAVRLFIHLDLWEGKGRRGRDAGRRGDAGCGRNGCAGRGAGRKRGRSSRRLRAGGGRPGDARNRAGRLHLGRE